ncbi:unnamed protein product [Brassica oleracea var. botrytis]
MCEFRGPVQLSPVATAPRLTGAAAPHLTVTVAPRLTVAPTPLSSREKSGSAQHELGPNRYVGLSVTAHLPCSVESPQASGEHNLLPVGAPSPSSGRFSGHRTSSEKISIYGPHQTLGPPLMIWALGLHLWPSFLGPHEF